MAVDRRTISWIAAGLLSFWACRLLGLQATPIDRALPWIALIAVVVAWAGECSAALSAVPLLIGAAICFPDTHTRLLAYGVVMAVALCGSILNVEEMTFPRAAVFAIAGTALIRWIAREHFSTFRELVLLLGVIAIVAVAKRSAVGIALAMAAALYTPAIPFRTLAIPIAFVLAALALRPLSTQHSALSTASLFAVALIVTLFAWSGILARTPRYLKYGRPAVNRAHVYWAMHPGESHDFEVVPDAHAVILSLSNGANLPRRTVVGRLGDLELHASDLADWGFARRQEWWRSTNRLPRHAAGLIRGYGYDGWVDGAVRFALPDGAKTIRISVDRRLPASTILQVEAFER